MGMRATGELFYGFLIGEAEDPPEWLMNEDPEQAFAIALGGEPEDWSQDYEVVKVAQERNRKILDAAGVCLVAYGHYDYQYLAIAASESRYSGMDWSGSFVDLDTAVYMANSSEWDAKLEAVAVKLDYGADVKRGWILAASYG
jgi:hypothetical protein